MKSIIAVATFNVATAKNLTQLTSPIGVPVREVYGNPKPQTLKNHRAPTTPIYQELRLSDNCTFPLDIVILQDATASFADDYQEMKENQLRLMTDAISATHPNSRFGIVSFKDKPILTLGDADDYCFYENLPLTPTNFTALYNTYDQLTSYGGADPAENQFGALIAAAQSKTIGWDQNPLATKLIVVATDAWYHYDADGLNNYGMGPFDGVIDFVNPATQCLAQYYPSPAQTRSALASIGAYAGFLVFDPEWAAGRPLTEWQWFNTFIGQDANFITTAKSDSSDFWINLAKIISTVEQDECGTSTTIAPPSPATCPCDPCPCAEVVIKLRQRPAQLHLDVEN